MRLWVRTLIRNSFFQVGAGIILTMVLGGFLLQWFESGEISKGDNPYWWGRFDFRMGATSIISEA